MMSQTFFVKADTGLQAKVPLHPGCIYFFEPVTEMGPYDERNKSYLKLVDPDPQTPASIRRVLASRGVVTIQRDAYTPVALNSFIDRCDPNVDITYASSDRPLPFEKVTMAPNTDSRHPYAVVLTRYDGEDFYFYPGARVQLDHLVQKAGGGGGSPSPSPPPGLRGGAQAGGGGGGGGGGNPLTLGAQAGRGGSPPSPKIDEEKLSKLSEIVKQALGETREGHDPEAFVKSVEALESYLSAPGIIGSANEKDQQLSNDASRVITDAKGMITRVGMLRKELLGEEGIQVGSLASTAAPGTLHEDDRIALMKRMLTMPRDQAETFASGIATLLIQESSTASFLYGTDWIRDTNKVLENYSQATEDSRKKDPLAVVERALRGAGVPVPSDLDTYFQPAAASSRSPPVVGDKKKKKKK